MSKPIVDDEVLNLWKGVHTAMSLSVLRVYNKITALKCAGWVITY